MLIRSLLASVFVCLVLMNASICCAEDIQSGFDTRLQYDIYFYSGENRTSVLENVEVKGFRQIGGRDFLVLSAKGFKLTEEEGYILFDSVIAILPSRHFGVRKADTIHLKGRRH